MSRPGFFTTIDSWAGFVAQTGALPENARGAPFELLVRHFLRSDPAYRAKLRHVWLLRDVPGDVREKLRLPGPDEGIDLIAETHTGEYWSVQAKYRSDTDASLTHRELATFTSLTFAVCRGISFGLICTTTERVTALFDHAEHIGELTNETWTALDAAFFASLRETLATEAPPPLPLARTPLPHQLRAIAAAHAHYVGRGAARGKLISPCGSGKSLTACWRKASYTQDTQVRFRKRRGPALKWGRNRRAGWDAGKRLMRATGNGLLIDLFIDSRMDLPY